ncbi:MAG: 4'-phosphopantetheinyl transferase superfamily protein [Paludibacteraceae bacterium]|nr:4'-phosphopantetheinyl transferase superfamily protein [Paludibacteraceae bacterium]
MQYVIFDDMTQCTEERVQELLPMVSAQRQAYALRYKHTFGRFCALQSWLMVEQLIGSSADWCYNEYGKPFIPNAAEFSLSHCKHAIAVAMGTHPVGIDCESIRPLKTDLVARTMNEQERERIYTAANPEREFTRLWTQKEAFLKYQGTGIIDDLQHVLHHADEKRFTQIDRDCYTVALYG